MQLHGKNFIGSGLSAEGKPTIFAFNPREGKKIDTPFYEATDDEIDRALNLAAQAAPELRKATAEQIASFLETLAAEIDALGDALLDQASLESGLTKDRLTGERARTTNQLKLFAGVVRDGAYLDVRIDTALPDRKPLPRPDLRRMLVPIGPVVVFGASNFPLAFSVAGGDTCAAFAARNPVVVKGHPAHPGTSEMVATAVVKAVKANGLPAGTFSLVNAADPAVSISLVQHPAAKAVGFTGSERAGRAIMDAAAQRPQPIPAYVEMGSINPVFVLPGALKDTDTMAQNFFNSASLGVGQFCTSPGVVVGEAGPQFAAFTQTLAKHFEKGAAGTMLHPGILQGYKRSTEGRSKIHGVTTVTSTVEAQESATQAVPVLFETDGITWMDHEELTTEIFGPSSVAVRARSRDELLQIAEGLDGTLTTSVFGTPEDLEENRDLVAVLETKAGRLIFNGFPTGVEVSPAMNHGGPYPATGDPKFTSVGTASIARFLRPVCFQNFPQPLLPVELQNSNERGIWRMINGTLTKDAL